MNIGTQAAQGDARTGLADEISAQEEQIDRAEWIDEAHLTQIENAMIHASVQIPLKRQQALKSIHIIQTIRYNQRIQDSPR